MKGYRVNDIFCSLQGEGYHTGRAAAFVRFSGCNLQCPFCDTDFDGYREMTAAQIVEELTAWPTRFVVLTGGEPALQADGQLTQALHAAGYEIAVETNGTCPLPPGIDWTTVSPKGRRLAVERCSEVKLLFNPQDRSLPAPHEVTLKADHYYLQPCDTGSTEERRRIVDACVDYVCRHPQWRLSLQTHKLAGFK